MCLYVDCIMYFGQYRLLLVSSSCIINGFLPALWPLLDILSVSSSCITNDFLAAFWPLLITCSVLGAQTDGYCQVSRLPVMAYGRLPRASKGSNDSTLTEGRIT